MSLACLSSFAHDKKTRKQSPHNRFNPAAVLCGRGAVSQVFIRENRDRVAGYYNEQGFSRPGAKLSNSGVMNNLLRLGEVVKVVQEVAFEVLRLR